MFVLGNLAGAFASILDVAVNVLWWLILIRAVISWVSPDPSNTAVQFLYRVTEPLLAPFRNIIPAWRLGVDVSPLFAMLVLIFIQRFIVRTLLDLSVIWR